MRNPYQSLLTFCFVLCATMMLNSQTVTKVDVASKAEKIANCDPANCTPAQCDAMVAAGKCTPEQAAKCKATCASTKVASAKLTREEGSAVEVSAEADVQPKSCAKSCSKMKAKAGKKSTL